MTPRRLALPAALAALAALAAGEAAAQPNTVPVVEHRFDDADEVQASLRGPEANLIHANPRLPRRTLLRPRTEFVREILETGNDR